VSSGHQLILAASCQQVCAHVCTLPQQLAISTAQIIHSLSWSTSSLKPAGTATATAAAHNGHTGAKQDAAADTQLAGAKGSNLLPSADLQSTALLPRQACKRSSPRIHISDNARLIAMLWQLCVSWLQHLVGIPCMQWHQQL
jgi:hypothetical protein